MLPKPPTAKGPAEWFTGDVWFDVIVRDEAREHVTDAEYVVPE